MKDTKTNMPRLSATAKATAGSNRIDTAKRWLEENYVLRENALELTPMPTVEMSSRNPHRDEWKHALSERDIFLHAQEDEVAVSRSVLRTLLESPNYMPREIYNPIADYFENLKGKYSGPSQIDLLVRSLHTVDDDRERTRWLFRKWLTATVACTLGLRQNDVALGLVSTEAGIGKTTFFEEIVPPQLRDYYQCVLKGDTAFLPTHGFATRLLLNFDELAAVTQASEDQFKQLLSSSSLPVRMRGSYRVETVPRMASVCFTSNRTAAQGGFIRSADLGILRRLAVIEVTAIDDYRSQLDTDQLWAEVMLLLSQGDYEWTQDDFRRFSRENLKYVATTNAMRLMKLWFRQPQEGDTDADIRFMTAADIVLLLQHERKITSVLQRVDEVSVGRALMTLGYRRYGRRLPDVGVRYGYDVVPLFGKT